MGMVMMQKVPFALSSSEARHKKANKETLVNMYAEALTPNSKSNIVLLGTPGWDLRLTLPTAPIIGMHFFLGVLYAVTQTKVYKIFENNTYIEIGDVSYTAKDFVSIADNGISMVIVGGNGYQYDGTTFAQITDAAFYPSDTVTFQDGYFIFNRSGTNQFFLSGLYAVTFDGTMYASAEGSPDNIVGLISDRRQLWIFGTQSIEVWYNSGDPLFPFDRIQGAFSHRGCMDKRTISAINNTVYWVGDDGVVYMANGYTPQPISTSAVEYRIATRVNDTLHAFTYTEEGHFFYVLTIDDMTFVFDTKTALWHNRESLAGRWGISGIVRDLHGDLTGSDPVNGNIYRVGLDYYTENGQAILREAETSPLKAGVDYATIHAFELDMETGKSLINEDDEAQLSVSSDGGVSFGNSRRISIGKTGERKKRVIWRRLGRHRNITIKVSLRSKAQVNIIAAYASVS